MKGMDVEKRLMSWTGILPAILILVFGLPSFHGQAGADDCTDFTKKSNSAMYSDHNLNWADQVDFEFATRGFIGMDRDLVIKDAQGNVIWSNGIRFVPEG